MDRECEMEISEALERNADIGFHHFGLPSH
jgi:hypothetical protein